MIQEVKSDEAFFRDLPAAAKRAGRIKDVGEALGTITMVSQQARRFKNANGRRFSVRGPYLAMLRAAGEASYYAYTRASNAEYRRLFIAEAEQVVSEWDSYVLSENYMPRRIRGSRQDPRWNAGIDEAGYWTRSLYDELFQSFSIGTKRDRLFSIEDPMQGTVRVNYNNRMLTHVHRTGSIYYQAQALNRLGSERPDVTFGTISYFFAEGYNNNAAKGIQTRIYGKTYDNYLRLTRRMSNAALLNHLKNDDPTLAINPIRPEFRDIQATKTEHPKVVAGQIKHYNHELEVMLEFKGY